jgi:hypothetical protein
MSKFVVLGLVEAARVGVPEALAVAAGVTQHEMKELGGQAVVEGGVALGPREVPVVLSPLEEQALHERQRVLEAAEGLAISDVDQLAQALLADDVNVAVEVRLEEFEHPAEHHGPFRAPIAKDDRDVGIAEARAVMGGVV